MNNRPLVAPWDRGWRSYCPACTWHSQDLPCQNPDSALHVLALHRALCKGTPTPPVTATYTRHEPIALAPAPDPEETP